MLKLEIDERFSIDECIEYIDQTYTEMSLEIDNVLFHMNAENHKKVGITFLTFTGA